MSSLFQTMRKTGLRFRLYLFFNFIAIIVTAFATVYSYSLTGKLTQAAEQFNTDILFNLIILIVAIVIIRGIFSALQALYQARFQAVAGYNLREVFLKHFLHAPFASVEESKSGENLSIFQNDLPAANNLISKDFISLVEQFILFVAGFLFLLYISPLYTFVSLGAAIVLLIIVMALSAPIQKLSKTMSEKEAAYNAIVNDSLQNISTIAAYSLHDKLESRFTTAFKNYIKAGKRMIFGIIIMILISFTAMMGPLVVIFTILGLAVINGELYLADFVAFSLTITISASAIMALGQGIGQFMQNAGRAKRLVNATSHEHEKETGVLPMQNKSIIFKDISFNYKEDLPIVLDNISFELQPGSKTALVGGSGSGKSTILKLLLGLYETQTGEIICGGHEIKEYGKKELRNMFSYVPQDSFLFPYSIGKNITLEDNINDMQRLENACKDAGILDFIHSLPEKFNDVLTEASENISGGQRQRIAMARAFYKQADIILFDEATSSLDPKTESEVLENLMTAAKDKTVIMVAHRAMSIAACDNIIVMDNGKICGYGTHDQLINSNPVYQGLYKKEVTI